jgi:lipoprotein-releasing system ATP-binding protein
MSGARVEIRQLRKAYDHGGQRLEVLRGIDLMIGAGEMVAVVGSSGAGKSTLLHVLGTLDRPSGGHVLYDGVDVTRMPPAQMADFRNRTIGFVFQFHHLLPEFTAVENCAMPALIAGASRADAVLRAKKLLDRVGLSERMTHRPGELSGGEQQRVRWRGRSSWSRACSSPTSRPATSTRTPARTCTSSSSSSTATSA